MKKDTITQFVCFVSPLERSEFVPLWEPYARSLMKSSIQPVLQQIDLPSRKNRFNYISLHAGEAGDFQFNFMRDERSGFFTDRNVRIIHAGGYRIEEEDQRQGRQRDSVTVFVFANHSRNALPFYSNLPYYQHMTIYEPFFESCTYRSIAAFRVARPDAAALTELVNKFPGTESAIYQDTRKSPRAVARY